MVSLRIGERAIPVAWRVIETKGAIGFEIKKPLLEDVQKMVPEGISILLAGDIFYGTSSLVGVKSRDGSIFIMSGGEVSNPIKVVNLLDISYC
jgi:hypothetical protein